MSLMSLSKYLVLFILISLQVVLADYFGNYFSHNSDTTVVLKNHSGTGYKIKESQSGIELVLRFDIENGTLVRPLVDARATALCLNRSREGKLSAWNINQEPVAVNDCYLLMVVLAKNEHPAPASAVEWLKSQRFYRSDINITTWLGELFQLEPFSVVTFRYYPHGFYIPQGSTIPETVDGSIATTEPFTQAFLSKL